ncbi:hypothetical protein TcG_08457 [Trypanosoma cruzi]|nr:hypothetical protein TcG_08457 [Trypanosoma cruzi]
MRIKIERRGYVFFLKMLRKRYRPLDPAEERSVDVEHKLQVGLLYDEQSYCFRWPDAPLTSMLRRSNASLTRAVHGNMVSFTQSIIAQPPIFTIDSIATEHGKRDLFASFSVDRPIISFSSGNVSPSARYTEIQRYKRHPGAPIKTSTEDSIFSFNAQQLKDLRDAGAFKAFREALSRSAPDSVNLDNEAEFESIARREMENELTRLEWQAFHESEKTAPALQRIFLLTTAVPFMEDTKKHGKEASTQVSYGWQRIVYDLWIKWRRETPMLIGDTFTDTNSSPWGSPLLTGAFISSLAKEYFLTGNGETNGAIKTGRLREKRGGKDKLMFPLTSPRRRGAYGYLRWRIDLYEPRIRSAWGGSRGENGDRGSAKMLSAAEVNKLINEKLPAALADVDCDERMDPVDALALTDIRSEVETWRHWLTYV